MEKTNKTTTIDFNAMHLDLECAVWQLENPTNGYEVNAATTRIMECMNELQGDPRYADHATTVLKCVKKRLNGEMSATELASHVQMISDLIGFKEGIMRPSRHQWDTADTIGKAKEKAKEAYEKAKGAVPDDLLEKMKDGAQSAYEKASDAVSGDTAKKVMNGAKEACGQISAAIPEDVKKGVKEGASKLRNWVNGIIDGNGGTGE